MKNTYTVGEYRTAYLKNEWGGDKGETRFLFLVCYLEARGKQTYALACKCNWQSKRPLIDKGGNAEWFDQSGNGVMFTFNEEAV